MKNSSSDHETQRLAALQAYRILDTAPEEEYDDLVALAAQFCEAPMASITLVDETRQWFKARIGLSDPQTPRTVSFCSQAIATGDNDLFVVNDARLDPRFSHYANVTGAPGIRFYAGAPLITPDGFALGTLCIIDRQPRTLTPEQSRALRVLRRHVVNALELRRLTHRQSGYIDQLQETQRALETARAEAVAATSAKSLFLATMTHEIRTPMNAVIGMTTLLRDSELTGLQRECVDTIHASGSIMLTLVNDILDFSKIEAGRLELALAPFAVADLIKSSINLLSGAAKNKGLALVTQLDAGLCAQVVGDETRLRQILVNLLANAVKFTARGGITLSAHTTPRPDGQLDLSISVTDTGIGIAPAQLARLFQVYSQAEASTSREYGGTGLGLAISQRLAALHGGRVEARSTPGEGSTFTLTVVVHPATSASPSAPRPAPTLDPQHAARHPARILVVDDNAINQKVALHLLRRLGYAPEFAAHGGEALAALLRQPFDLVLMDSDMPVMDGPTATRRIRTTLPAAQQPAIVALSAHSIEDVRAHWVADAYLTKPIVPAELMKILARLPELKNTPRA